MYISITKLVRKQNFLISGLYLIFKSESILITYQKFHHNCVRKISHLHNFVKKLLNTKEPNL